MTLYTLADQCGVSHAEARRIASMIRPAMRHAHKAQNLTRWEESQLRPRLLAAKIPARPPMLPGLPPKEETMQSPELFPREDKVDGLSLAIISEKMGIAEGTIKSLLSRHAELQALPYSAKAAGARVFFPPFVAWLAEHQGSEVAKGARPQPSQLRLPAGAQLRELRLMGEKKILSAAQIQRLLGVEVPPVIAIDGPIASQAEGEAAFGRLHLIAEGVEARS